MTSIQFELDETTVRTEATPDQSLRDLLRDEFGKLGVKSACMTGKCGVCTIHLDGAAVKSCLVMAPKADGTTITTVEGLSGEQEGLHEVQQAFIENFASQCGYCTPGFVMSAVEYVEGADNPDREEIRQALKGNLCRCTGYKKIVDAVEQVARN